LLFNAIATIHTCVQNVHLSGDPQTQTENGHSERSGAAFLPRSSCERVAPRQSRNLSRLSADRRETGCPRSFLPRGGLSPAPRQHQATPKKTSVRIGNVDGKSRSNLLHRPAIFRFFDLIIATQPELIKKNAAGRRPFSIHFHHSLFLYARLGLRNTFHSLRPIQQCIRKPFPRGQMTPPLGSYL